MAQLNSTPRSLLEAWERLSAAETEAIQTGDWIHLETLHATLRQLMADLQSGLDQTVPLPPELKSIAQGIGARAHANLALVERRRQDAIQEGALLEQTRWNLRRQHHSFGRPQAGNWQRYS